MIYDLLYGLAGIIGLYFGAEWLVNGSSALARRLGVSALVIGLTIVAFGTSAPELLVCLDANMKPSGGDAAIGNIVGSNICNIALILGVSALIRRMTITPQMVKREMPTLLAATGIFVALFWDNRISFKEGLILILGIVAFLLFAARTSAGQIKIAAAQVIPDKELLSHPGKCLFLIVIGLIFLIGGAKLLVTSGESIALRFGISKAIIGLTLFAVGTSLPELATSIIAAAKREGDLLIGNVIGSCIFNIFAIGGIVAVVKPIQAPAVEPLDIGFMTGITFLLLPILWFRNDISRIEGSVFLLIFAVYCYFIFERIQSESSVSRSDFFKEEQMSYVLSK